MSRDVSFEEDVIDRLARIEERASAAASLLEARGAVLDKLDHRLTVLERHRSYLAGAMAVIAAAAGMLWHLLPVPMPKL